MNRRRGQGIFSEKFTDENSQNRMNPWWISHAVISLLTVLGLFGLYHFQMSQLKGVLTDGLFRLQWWKSPHPDIRLIAFDDLSNERYGSTHRIPPEEIEKLLGKLQSVDLKALALIGPIGDKNYSQSELSNISKQLSQIPHGFIGYTDDTALGKPIPLGISSDTHYLPGFVSRDTLSYATDSVTRRVMLEIDGVPTVYKKIASLFHPPGMRYQGAHYSRFNAQSLQAFIRWQGGPRTYDAISSRDVVEGRVSPEAFRNKIVLIGLTLSSRKDVDYIMTPFSRNYTDTTQLEGAAQGLGTLLYNNGVWRLPEWFEYLFCLIFGLVTVNLALILSPIPGIILVVSEILVLALFGWTSLHLLGGWFNTAHPIVLISLSYYLIIPYRLLQEYQRRWHYQEKSEFMVQLELLKSNFLSLVTHDLKTPIARIHGNTELLLTRPGIKEEDRQRLGFILETAEDMSEYVETILDLTRIEASQIPIQKVTKDINETLKEVVQNKRKLAAEKEIQLQTRLEPLFSIKYDVKLIRRVIANLVENAIKYSPPHSQVTLSSNERDNWICISVSDQGVGIAANEQEKVFQKFYRCQNESTQSTKGTGLGLYLVKYFVELHQGKVTLASQPGFGSTFSILLPIGA